MALFAWTALDRQEHFPATATQTFAALEAFLLKSGWTTTKLDDDTMFATFTTWMSAMSYGTNGAVRVAPDGEGSSLSVSVTLKWIGQLGNSATRRRISNEVFAGVAAELGRAQLAPDSDENPDNWL